MISPMMEESGPEAEAPELVPVGEWPTWSEASDHALVVLAMNLECWIFPGQGTYAVFANPSHAPAIRHEYELYAEEQSQRREHVEPPLFPAGLTAMFAWAFTLLAVFLWQGRDFGFTDRFVNSSIGVMEHGEWWRAFTSLFLHADGGHLLGNVAIGGIFCLMVAKTIGAWRAWPLILISGTIANLLNAWLHYPGAFSSLGASTATFAALGILVGTTVRQAWRHRSYLELRPLVAPALAGMMMLTWYGTSGENTDVAGHFLGWGCGAVLGGLAARK